MARELFESETKGWMGHRSFWSFSDDGLHLETGRLQEHARAKDSLFREEISRSAQTFRIYVAPRVGYVLTVVNCIKPIRVLFLSNELSL